jgi:hypothetical protein
MGITPAPPVPTHGVKTNRKSFTPAHLIAAVPLMLLLVGYVAYLSLVIASPTGPVDFDTFCDIGARFLSGASPYGENSYYPLPYVAIFSLLAALPRELAALLWLGLPVVLAVAISGPWVLAYAPMFAHFAGGQSALFGLLGFWALRKNPAAWWTIPLLALSTIKPQLAVVPVVCALWTWLKGGDWRRLAWFSVSLALLWLPWFFIRPGWVREWLANPRDLKVRAMSALVPRALLVLPSSWFWLALLLAAVLLVWLLRRSLHLDIAVLLWFILSPLVHDYDLIQLIPIAAARQIRLAAVLSSLPMWGVILFAYDRDEAWFLSTLIAPVLLFVLLKWNNLRHPASKTNDPMISAETPLG